MMLHIGFTGTRQGMTIQQKTALTFLLQKFKSENGAEYFHHGDCVGADEQAHEIALKMGYKIIIHPPENNKYRAFCEDAVQAYATHPYLVRNQHIVNECDFLIGTPKENIPTRSGTWSTIHKASIKGCGIEVIKP